MSNFSLNASKGVYVCVCVNVYKPECMCVMIVE